MRTGISIVAGAVGTVVSSTFVLALVFAALAAGGCMRSQEERIGLALWAEEEAMLLTHPAGGEPRTPEETIANTVARFGTEPYRLLALDGPRRYLVMLRHASRVVLLDEGLQLLDSIRVPRSPVGWDLVDGRHLLVVGELSANIGAYHVSGSELRHLWDLPHGGARARDLVRVGDHIYALNDFDDSMQRLELPEMSIDDPAGGLAGNVDGATSYELGSRPLRVRSLAGHLFVNELLGHALVVIPLVEGEPELGRAIRIEHDGPIWSFDVQHHDDGFLVVAGGVENRPLDRTGGEFGYVDSFLFAYHVPRLDGREVDSRSGSEPPNTRATLLAELNLSEIPIVTPKAIHLLSEEQSAAHPECERLRVTVGCAWVSGFGSETLGLFAVRPDRLDLLEELAVPAGVTDFVVESERIVATSTLIDRVVTVPLAASTFRTHRIRMPDAPELGEARDAHAVDVRLGEQLFYTTLMAPDNRTEGELSRFSCETCHFEGGVDGRTHYTGRDDVFATTKTLRGLANNVPLFSRAGDSSLAVMIMNEFRVANQERQAFFDLPVDDHAWLRELGDLPDVLAPADQRRAMLAFFVDSPHPPNPQIAQGATLGDGARRALTVFRDRCASCHQAGTSTRDAGEGVAFAEWADWLQLEGRDAVWGAASMTKTGIVPYISARGARVPSLRRVWDKRPYFTNGSASSMRDLLERFRYRGARAWHHYDASAERARDRDRPEGGDQEPLIPLPPPAEGGVSDGPVVALTAEEVDLLEALLRLF